MHIRDEKRKIATSVIAIVILLGIVLIVTYFNRPIRRFVNMPKQLVEGARDGNFQDFSKEKFTKELTTDTKEEINQVKENILNTTFRDVITFINKGEKILHDVDHLQRQAGEVVNTYDPFKK